MEKKISLRLPAKNSNDTIIIKNLIAKFLSVDEQSITGYNILKKSFDARSKIIFTNLTLQVYINEPFLKTSFTKRNFLPVSNARHKVIIVGAGPAGLFAALKLIEQGIQPIILERGKNVRLRRRDLATLNKSGIINTESNYCFGEGGAGTYSDGKLYTRSTKRGDVDSTLNLFAQFGADENILYESHPHIGTNKLPQIITAMRTMIEECGGEFLFDKKVCNFTINNNKIQSLTTADGDTFKADAYIFATGHSARDIFLLLHEKNILIEKKSFALGVRVEHPQQLIDSIQYHCTAKNDYLPPASYSLVQQVKNKGVFSFCMCPGGIIAPASTNENELVVNGWSPSKRNNPFANSGIVVQVEEKDLLQYRYQQNQPLPDALCGMYFQQSAEEKAYNAGGGNFIAPAQRLTDFCNNKNSSSLPNCSYVPGVTSANLKEVLPVFIHTSLQKAFIQFGKKMKGYFTDEAIVLATESRTSSPVKIPRDNNTLQHVQIENLYPCGEGAGYAGGIVSAAMDGERVATAIVQKLT